MELKNNPNSLEGGQEILEIDLESADRVQQLKILDVFHKGEKDAAVGLVVNWLERLEEWAVADPTLRRRIILETKRADFYLAMGDTDGAFDCLEDACIQASHEGHFDLMSLVEQKIAALEKVTGRVHEVRGQENDNE